MATCVTEFSSLSMGVFNSSYSLLQNIFWGLRFWAPVKPHNVYLESDLDILGKASFIVSGDHV